MNRLPLTIIAWGLFAACGGTAPLAADEPVENAAASITVPPPPEPAVPADAATEELQAASSESARQVQLDDGWTIVISPAPQRVGALRVSAYESTYEAIPYRRTEYLANPSYRHDATMEFLFDQMRPTVIQRQDTPVRVENPRPVMQQPYPLSLSEFTRYFSPARWGRPWGAPWW